MKNITNFNKFKKINEEAAADPRAGNYSGGGDTYFANVKGNMAGAENTLIGSAVMKIFGFFKRKINEGILFLYKKALFREYLANVLRYATKNGIKYQDANTLYEVQKIMDENSVDIEEKVTIKVKFINENTKLLTNYIVGSGVKMEDEKIVEDGIYQITNDTTTFSVKGGKIVKIAPIKASTTSQPQAQSGTTSADDVQQIGAGEEHKKTDDNASGDLLELQKQVADLVNKLSKVTDKIERQQLLENKDKILNQINAEIKILNKSQLEITNILKRGGLSETMKTELNIDLKTVKEELVLLGNIKASIDKLSLSRRVAPIVKKTEPEAETTPITPNPPKEKEVADVQNTEENTEENKTESVEFNDDEVLNERIISKGVSFRGIKLTGVDKKLADEVGNLDMSILENEDFAKKFEPKEIKDAVTALVKENARPIIKIQAAAERMFAIGDASPARDKLKNTWQRMVNDDLALFSRYMHTNEVNPFNLIEKAPNAEDIRKEAGAPNSMANNAQDLANAATLKDNKVLSLKPGFSDTNAGSGIMISSYGHLIYVQDKVKIGEKTFWGYKIMRIIDDIEGLKAIKDEGKIKDYIVTDPLALAKRLGFPDKTTYGSPIVTFEYKCSYIISKGAGRLDTSRILTDPATNNVNLLGLYVKSGVQLKGKLEQADYAKTWILMFRTKTNVSKLLNNATKQTYDAAIYPFGLKEVLSINGADEKYGLTTELKEPRPIKLGEIEVIKLLKQ